MRRVKTGRLFRLFRCLTLLSANARAYTVGSADANITASVRVERRRHGSISTQLPGLGNGVSKGRRTGVILKAFHHRYKNTYCTMFSPVHGAEGCTFDSSVAGRHHPVLACPGMTGMKACIMYCEYGIRGATTVAPDLATLNS